MSRLFVVGLSHRTAPIEIREALALGKGDEVVQAQVRQAATLCGEAMVLSTCNRVELYGALPSSVSETLWTQVEELLIEQQPTARQHLYRLSGDEAVRHLFRVASSLDSMVVGEPQILGQVKTAYRIATTAGTVGSVLGSVVPRAFAVAKRIRSETAIGQSASSVASVAVDLARQIFGELRGHPVMLLGAGKMAELCARHLREAGATEFLVVNRTLSRAEQLAALLGGSSSAHGLPEVETLLGRAAVVICSAGAPEPLLRAELVARAMKARRGRWLLLIDIAVPRDIEPQVAKLENVYLYDIDALANVVAGNLGERQRAAEAAEAIVQAELGRSLARARAGDVVPVIKALRERAQTIAEAEVKRILPRLGPLGEREKALVASMAEAVVNKLLHAPLTTLKRSAAESSTDGNELAAAVRRLWSLEPPPDEPLQNDDDDDDAA